MTERGVPTGLDAALPLLACPHCSLGLRREGGAVGCPSGHRFDVARQGYLSLLGVGARTDTGDSSDMVAARTAFLAAGHYRPIAEAISDVAHGGAVVEIGAGTGYYVSQVLDLSCGPDAIGLALDASRYAARRAASAHPRVGSIVADAWSTLPVRSGVIATVLSVFAPRDPAEIVRILAPGGRAVVVTPEPDHLFEIRAGLGLLTVDPGKTGRLAEAFSGRLRPTEHRELRRMLELTPAAIEALARMGPSARHVSPERLRAAITELDDVTEVTMAVTITVLQA